MTTTRTAADALEQMPAPYSNATAEGYGDWCAAMLSWALHWQDVIRAALATPQPLTDAQIVEIRDDHLPSQGEPFDCIAFARAILNASSHEHVYCPHCRPCKHSERVDAYDGVLRGLASYLSAGGFNSTGLIDPEVADAKIRWGIDNFVKVEVDRLLRATQNNGHSPEVRSALEPTGKDLDHSPTAQAGYGGLENGNRHQTVPAGESPAQSAPVQEPTITVSGPVACGKSYVMELIYKALRDAGLHPYSNELAHERRMVEEQPPPPAKVWKLREAVYAAPPPPAPAQEPVDVAASSIRNGSTNKGDKMINYTGRHKDSFDRFFASTQKEKPVGWRKDLNPPHGNFTLQWLEENPWPEQNHVQPLYAAPPPDEARELMQLLVQRYDDYRGKGISSAPGWYQMVVDAIERIRAFLKDRT